MNINLTHLFWEKTTQNYTREQVSEILKVMDEVVKLSTIQSDTHDLKRWYPTTLLSAGISSNKSNRKYAIFANLVETCLEWNRIDGFFPNWTDGVDKAVIYSGDNTIRQQIVTRISRPLYFKDLQTARMFVEVFRKEIEQVKDLI